MSRPLIIHGLVLIEVVDLLRPSPHRAEAARRGR